MSFDPVCRVSALRDIERDASSAPLMERAGRAAADVARDMLDGRRPRVLLLAGGGNNGGDAFVAARHLATWFFDVVVLHIRDGRALPRDAEHARKAWLDAGGATIDNWPDGAEPGLIIDGLFGIGLTRAVDGAAKAWVERANASGVPVLAIDIPSGLDATTGVAGETVVRAAHTATFIALKPGLLTGDGPDCCGRISIHDLDLTDAVAAVAQGRRLDWSGMRGHLPAQLLRGRRNVNKGTFGSLGIIGGGNGMEGAAILAGRAALHLGVGKVWVGMAADAVPAVDWMQPELMLQRAGDMVAKAADALVVGPGLGTSDHARELVAAALKMDLPLLLDADALNLLAADPGLFASVAQRSAPTVITPHPGEAARLMHTTTAEVQGDRLGTAVDLAARLRACVVLKGAGTVIARPDGRFAINGTGGPALASGGTGDVLSGMAGALLAQHVPCHDAAELAVCLHGAAADLLVAEHAGPAGLTASELTVAARRLLNTAAMQATP